MPLILFHLQQHLSAFFREIPQPVNLRMITHLKRMSIAPGFIISDMTAALSDEVREAWVKTIPLRRGGTVEEVAKVALFLASDLSSYVSGQVINCCGAMNC